MLKHNKWNSTVLSAVIFMVVSLVYLVEALRTALPIKDGVISITFFPCIIAILTLLTSLVLLSKGLKEKKSAIIEWHRISRSVIVVLLTVIFVFLFEKIGYFLSSLIYTISLVTVFSLKDRHVIKTIVFSVGIVFIVFLLFEKAFNVRLPSLWEMF